MSLMARPGERPKPPASHGPSTGNTLPSSPAISVLLFPQLRTVAQPGRQGSQTGRQTRQRNTMERIWGETQPSARAGGKEQVKLVKQVQRRRETAVGKVEKGVRHLAWSMRDTRSSCCGDRRGKIRNCLDRRAQARDFYEPRTESCLAGASVVLPRNGAQLCRRPESHRAPSCRTQAGLGSIWPSA